MTQSIPPAENNYLLFSDVHLGADLVQHTRPWTASRLQEALCIDHDLGSLLDHYLRDHDPERPWRLVIAGDFIDLVGMSISPGDGVSLDSPLSADELTHGLGSAEDRAALKMRAVALRHDALFRKLARFVEAGHSLVLVRGNHDVELYWEAAQRAFLSALVSRSRLAPDDAAGRKLLSSRVEFRHWFFYVHGLLYVEHGHQYDAACAYHHVLAPRSPLDPKRISYSFSDILVRYVVRPTRELSVEGHENNSIFDYLRLAFSLGVRGCARLGYRFFSAVGHMVAVWREHLSEPAAQIRAEHEQSMQQIATRFRLSLDNLRAMARLWATPVTGRLSSILRSVFLDGLAAVFVSGTLITALGALDFVPLAWLPLIMGATMLALFVYMKRCRVVEPHEALRRGAGKLAELMPARYIVMGHTHKPLMEPIAHASTYVNLGNWTDDLLRDDLPKSPCTYLVVRHDASGKTHAQLCAWDSREGPRVLATDAAAALGGAALPQSEPAQAAPVVGPAALSGRSA